MWFHEGGRRLDRGGVGFREGVVCRRRDMSENGVLPPLSCEYKKILTNAV